MSLSQDFRDLAGRFRRIHADDTADAQRQVEIAAGWGMKLCKQASDAGFLQFPDDFPWPATQSTPSDDRTVHWYVLWVSFVSGLQHANPDELPDNPLGIRWEGRETDIAEHLRVGSGKATDWRLVAENFAIVADRLAEECSKSKPLSSGEAFLRAIQNDPEGKAAWERTQPLLRDFAAAMQEAMKSPEYLAAREAEKRKWQDLHDAIRAGMELAGNELSARHFSRPESLEDWERLARIVEISPETIGELTLREIHERAVAWADRQTIKAKLAGGVGDETQSTQSEHQTKTRTKSSLNQQAVIEKLERETPVLDAESVEWVAARKKNVEKLGLPIKTLRDYRLVSYGGRKMPDEMFGIDRDGRIWRRQGTRKSTVYYYVPSLRKASNKASN